MGYISNEDQKSLGERYSLTAWIITALGVAALIYLVIPRIVIIKPQLLETVNFTNLLYSAALLIGLTVVIVRRILLSRVMLGGAARQGGGAVLARLSMTSLICGALGEMVGIFGLVGYLSTGESFAWPIGIISLVLILYSFPRKGEWVRALEKADARSAS